MDTTIGSIGLSPRCSGRLSSSPAIFSLSRGLGPRPLRPVVHHREARAPHELASTTFGDTMPPAAPNTPTIGKYCARRVGDAARRSPHALDLEAVRNLVYRGIIRDLFARDLASRARLLRNVATETKRISSAGRVLLTKKKKKKQLSRAIETAEATTTRYNSKPSKHSQRLDWHASRWS